MDDLFVVAAFAHRAGEVPNLFEKMRVRVTGCIHFIASSLVTNIVPCDAIVPR
jgi:hypothetical protein